jgi:AcrR family transcriptional regulator
MAKRAQRPNQQRRKEETRRALVEVAVKLFNSVGYHGTDSNRIARAAGYSPGTFYTYFPDKMAIFLEVDQEFRTLEWKSIESALKSGLKGKALRSRMLRDILGHHREWKAFRATVRSLSVIDKRVHAARLAQRERQIAMFKELVRLRGRPAPSRAWILACLLNFDVLCDAIADGDVKQLGLRETDVMKILDDYLGRIV